jgi:polyhydroxyalkanoate synthesis regulator phasin
VTEPLTPDRLGAVRERQGERSRSFAHRPCWADVEVLLGEVERLRRRVEELEAEGARPRGDA